MLKSAWEFNKTTSFGSGFTLTENVPTWSKRGYDVSPKGRTKLCQSHTCGIVAALSRNSWCMARLLNIVQCRYHKIYCNPFPLWYASAMVLPELNWNLLNDNNTIAVVILIVVQVQWFFLFSTVVGIGISWMSTIFGRNMPSCFQTMVNKVIGYNRI